MQPVVEYISSLLRTKHPKWFLGKTRDRAVLRTAYQKEILQKSPRMDSCRRLQIQAKETYLPTME